MENNNQVLKMEELLNEKISQKVKRVNENKEIDYTIKKRKWYKKYLKITKTHEGLRYAKKSLRRGEPLQILEIPERVSVIDEWEFCGYKYTDVDILNEAIRNKLIQLKNQFQENSSEISQLEFDISDLRRRIAEEKNNLVLQIAPSKQIENKEEKDIEKELRAYLSCSKSEGTRYCSVFMEKYYSFCGENITNERALIKTLEFYELYNALNFDNDKRAFYKINKPKTNETTQIERPQKRSSKHILLKEVNQVHL